MIKEPMIISSRAMILFRTIAAKINRMAAQVGMIRHIGITRGKRQIGETRKKAILFQAFFLKIEMS